MKASASQQKLVCNRQVRNGPVGLNIPELPEDAANEEILAALDHLEAAKASLLAKRKALAEEAEGFYLPEAPKISEDQAVLRSSQIKGILKESKKSITDLTGIGNL